MVGKKEFVKAIMKMQRERKYAKRRNYYQDEADRHILWNWNRIQKATRQMPKMRGVNIDR